MIYVDLTFVTELHKSKRFSSKKLLLSQETEKGQSKKFVNSYPQGLKTTEHNQHNMAAKKFEGKWVFDRSEGMEAIVSALNLPADKVPKSGQTTLEYKIAGSGTFTLTASHPKSGKNIESTFTVGERFKAEELSAYLGKDVYATPSWTGEKLVVQGEGGQATITREIVGNELVSTFNVGGATGKRIFRKA